MANTNLRNFGFSSPLGVGLVLDGTCFYYTGWTSFSSPSGDGLVLEFKILETMLTKIFVPAWGWVGSILKKQLKLSKGDFRPRVGMGWFGSKIPLI